MRLLAFEDSTDIEALLIAGGLDLATVTMEQRWHSTDALSHIQRFAPDVLLLNHYMPPNTGYDVLQALLNARIARPPTIVAMSSESSKNDAMVTLGADIGVVKYDLASLPLWSTLRG